MEYYNVSEISSSSWSKGDSWGVRENLLFLSILFIYYDSFNYFSCFNCMLAILPRVEKYRGKGGVVCADNSEK